MAVPDECPLCKASADRQLVITRHVYGDASGERAFFHCTSCDIRYQYPTLSPDQNEQFYHAEFETFMTGRTGDTGADWQTAENHVLSNENTRKRRMAYLKPYSDNAKTILEIGCSSGFMLFPFLEKGKVCVGVEPSGVFKEFLKSRGIPVFRDLQELIETRSGPLAYDLIQHFFVLEHIPDPISFLMEQVTLLSDKGSIVFEVPNVADPLLTIYDVPSFERFYWSLAHPWYFSEEALAYLLDKVGRPYTIQRDQRYDLSNHFCWALEGRPGGSGRFSSQLGEKLESVYKSELIRSGHCDTLIVTISR
jgi:SAM-dependent methyltransferase